MIQRQQLLPLRILATGKALPQTRVDSTELDHRLGKPAGYVQERCGIEYRHLATAQESQAELGAQALNDAIACAGISPSSIDLLISACAIAVQALPCTATHILRHSSLPDGTPGFDVNLSCASFVSALQIAAGLLQTGSYRRIAIVSSELASRGLNWEDEDSSYLFGDGAACAIVEQGDGTSGILAHRMASYAREGTYCEIKAGGTRCNPHVGMQESDFYFRMDGRQVFKLARKYIRDFQNQLLADACCTLDDIDLVIPHQASHLGIEHVQKLLGIDSHRMMNIYPQHGNQVGASIPTALHEAHLQGRCPKGSKIMLLGTAASISLASTILVI